jgi:exopolysaccharide biosynthesis protein
MYIIDHNHVRKCGCEDHKGSCSCVKIVKPKVTKDAEANATGVPCMAEEMAKLQESRAASNDPVGMASRAHESGLIPAYTTAELFESTEEPEEDEDCEAEKTVADKLRQARDSKDPHKRNFLSAFYRGRAAERSKRQA